MATPQYARIKDALLRQISSGELSPGDRVASENQLVSTYGVSRMTARRALHELAEEGVLLRVQGLGSFVADERPVSSLLQIRNIADEIHSRGHSHRCDCIVSASQPANPMQARQLALEDGAQVFHTVLVHRENGLPVQYEERFVNPAMAPDYLQQDFTQTTPNAYLSGIAPLTEADNIVEAVTINTAMADLLQVPASEPCLRVTRRTWSARGVVSLALLTHPGSRYRLGGHINF